MRAFRRVLLAGLCTGSCVLALDPARPLASFSVTPWANGHETSIVSHVFQDSNGYLRVSTSLGLVRYDGVSHNVWNTESSEAIVTTLITQSVEDSEGRFWVATNGGGLVVEDHGEFYRFSTEDGLPDDSVRSVFSQRDGTVWIGTRRGVCTVDLTTFDCFGIEDGLPDLRVGEIGHQTFAEDSSGRLWVATHLGVAYYQNDRFHHVPDAVPKDDRITALLGAPDGSLWAGTAAGRLGSIVEGSFVPVGIWPAPTATISSLSLDNHGALWVGSFGSGLFRWHLGRLDQLSSQTGLVDDTVNDVLVDRDAAVWLASSRGLYRLTDAPFKIYGVDQGLSGSLTIGLAPGNEGLWVVTDEGGLNQLQGDRFHSFGSPPEVAPTFVRRVLEDRNGKVWIGTQSGLWEFVDSHFVKIQSFPEDRQITAIAEMSSGDLWVGTLDGGALRLRQGEWTAFSTHHGLPDPRVITFEESHSGGIWIGTHGGLAYFDDVSIETFEIDHRPAPHIVLALHEEAAGDLWIGTLAQGIFRKQGENFTSYSKDQGLGDNTIWALLGDPNGGLWMSHDGLISRLSIPSIEAFDQGRGPLEVRNFGREDGLFDTNSIGGFHSSGVVSPSGLLHFANASGVATIDPNRPIEPYQVAPPRVETVAFDGESLPRSLLVSSNGIEVGPEVRRVTVGFSSLTFTAANQIRFRYRLMGFDPEWTPARELPQANFSNLPPGEYRLQFEATISPGHPWIAGENDLVLKVVPNWYEGMPARVLLLGLLLSWVALFHRSRVTQARNRAEQLEEVVVQRTQQLNAANVDLKEKNELLFELSMTDPLTETANRRLFEETLAREWRRAMRSSSRLSMLIVDVDYFKTYNDTFGHAAGDVCLQRIATTLQETAGRAGELVARIGGDEFVVLVPESSEDDIIALGNLLVAAVASLQLELSHPDASDEVMILGISVGAASMVPSRGQAQTLLFGHADEALFQAKAQGRNRVVIHRDLSASDQI